MRYQVQGMAGDGNCHGFSPNMAMSAKDKSPPSTPVALPEQKAFFKIPARLGRKRKGESGFEGDATVEYTFEHIEPGTEI